MGDASVQLPALLSASIFHRRVSAVVDWSTAGEGVSLVYAAASAALAAMPPTRVILLSALNGPAHHLGVLRKMDSVAASGNLSLLHARAVVAAGDEEEVARCAEPSAVIDSSGAEVLSGGWLDVALGAPEAGLPVSRILSTLARLCDSRSSGSGALILIDCVSSLATLLRSDAETAALVRGAAALAGGNVRLLFRVTPATDLFEPVHAGCAAVAVSAQMLAMCDAVATLRPLASGRTHDVLGRLLLEERLAIRSESSGGDGWLPPPPRSCLYRLVETSCALVGVGPMAVGDSVSAKL